MLAFSFKSRKLNAGFFLYITYLLYFLLLFLAGISWRWMATWSCAATCTTGGRGRGSLSWSPWRTLSLESSRDGDSISRQAKNLTNEYLSCIGMSVTKSSNGRKAKKCFLFVHT